MKHIIQISFFTTLLSMLIATPVSANNFDDLLTLPKTQKMVEIDVATGHEEIKEYSIKSNFGNEGLAPYDIIGNDDRWPIDDPASYPFRYIAKIKYTKNGNTHSATGFLVGKDLVLTAGHVAQNSAGQAKDWKLYFGLNYNDEYLAYAEVTGVYIPYEWRTSYNDFHDWCLLKLDRKLDEKLGPPLDCQYKPTLLFDTILISGYITATDELPSPSDKVQFTSDGKVNSENAYLIFYELDTSDGTSGAPIFSVTPDISSLTYMPVVGIHTKGPDEEISPNCNRGTRISISIKNMIEIYS